MQDFWQRQKLFTPIKHGKGVILVKFYPNPNPKRKNQIDPNQEQHKSTKESETY